MQSVTVQANDGRIYGIFKNGHIQPYGLGMGNVGITQTEVLQLLSNFEKKTYVYIILRNGQCFRNRSKSFIIPWQEFNQEIENYFDDNAKATIEFLVLHFTDEEYNEFCETNCIETVEI